MDRKNTDRHRGRRLRGASLRADASARSRRSPRRRRSRPGDAGGRARRARRRPGRRARRRAGSGSGIPDCRAICGVEADAAAHRRGDEDGG
ncbi:MAG: hypothetical protein EXQ53_11775 [Acidobacteria bacterium]|nr:hypothetical protein [Acidobacteriota bacterium]